MTLVEGAPQRERAEPATPPGPRPGVLGRLWGAPLWAHLAALAAVLIALIPVVGTDASFSADEGAAIAQARSLSRGGGWIVEHPMPEVDPTSRAYPLELSASGQDGLAPYAKHPAYALALAAADRLGGVTGMVLLSLFGTLLAAALTAAIAGRLDPSLRRPALWTVGLASPLLFDGYLVMAHTLGAAAVAAAALVALVAIERRSALLAAAVAPLVAVAILFRTEATLLAVAVAVVALVVALRRREARVIGLVLSGAALAGAAVTRVLEKVWADAVIGGTAPYPGPAGMATDGFLDGRLNSVVLTWLRPSYDGPPSFDIALILVMGAIALGAFVARRRPQDGHGITMAAVLAVAGVAAGLVLSPHNLVPGLLPAFPLGLAGLLLVGRPTLGSTPARVLFGTFVLFSAAVIATQYAAGGTAEWGGRYFAVGLPLLVPVALLALRHHAAGIGPAATRTATVALVACSVGMAAMSVASIRSTHRFTATLMSQIDRAGRGSGDRTPVMVTTSGAIPRLAWATADRQRWLLVRPDELAEMMGRLRAIGVDQVTFVTRFADHDREKLADSARVTATTPTPGNGWAILSLALD